MAFPASEVVRRARDRHPAFTEHVAPTQVLLRELTEYARELRGRVAKFRPEELELRHEITLPLADFEAGYSAIPANIEVRGGETHFTGNDTTDFELIDWKERHGIVPRYSGWLETGTLYLIRNAEYWSPVTKIVLHYVPVQAEIATAATAIDLPDNARSPLSLHLAVMMAARVPADSEVPVQAGLLVDLWEKAEARFLEDLVIQQRAKVTGTREVW